MTTDRTAEFTAWVRKQPADGEYNYFDGRCCPFYRFLESTGAPVASVGGITWIDTNGRSHDIPRRLLVASSGYGVLSGSPSTFGALLTRLEALK